MYKNHPLVFPNSKIMFTWHICYTSNSASSQFTRGPWSHWKLEDQLRGTTATNLPAPTVSPWTLSPLPRSNRGYRGKTVIPIPVQLSTRFAYYNRVGEEKRVFDNSVKSRLTRLKAEPTGNKTCWRHFCLTVLIISYVDSYRDIDSYVTILSSLPT